MKRQLAAVLAADICDYSRLMGEAMLGALRRLRAEVFGPSVASRRGRIVKSMGDGWIVLFGSAVEAVESAMQVQDRLAEGAKPGEPEIHMRVGIHLGDVVEEDDDVFGDGVNVAARLEQTTAPGTTAISEAVLGSLDGTLRPSFDEAGAWQLKNIARPVQVWVRGDDTGALPARAARADDLQIAVVPVAVSDSRDEVRELANAITGEVASFLGGTMWMTATTTQTPDAAKYVLRSTLRSSGTRLRLETQLQGTNGTELHKTKADGDLDDVFDWQDTVSEDIAGEVVQRIFDLEQSRLDATPDAGPSAADHALRAGLAMEHMDAAGLTLALEHSTRAIDLDPQRRDALCIGLTAYFGAISLGLGEIVALYRNSATDWSSAARMLTYRHPLIDVALVINPLLSENASTAEMRRVHDRALRASSLDYVSLAFIGFGYGFIGLPDIATDCLNRALKLGRRTPWRLVILGGLGLAALQQGQFERTIQYCRDGLEISPGFLTLYRQLAASHAQLGQMEEARAALAELLERKPDETIAAIRNRSTYADTPGMQLFFDGLRMAGLPE